MVGYGKFFEKGFISELKFFSDYDIIVTIAAPLVWLYMVNFLKKVLFQNRNF